MHVTRRCATAMMVVVCIAFAAPILGANAAPLQLEAKISLGEINGRIDHLTVDLNRQRLFVAELGNDSIAIVDLKTRSVVQRIRGLKAPQGVGYAAALNLLIVANAGDGSVQFFHGNDFSLQGQMTLGDDADNVRIDPRENRVYIGYGNGAVAVIDPVRRVKLGDISLKAHPEGFQLDRATNRIYANVPEAKEVAVIDANSQRQMSTWPLRTAAANFPLAIDTDQQRVFVVTRHPATLLVYDARDGTMLSNVAVCGDADDVFADSKRHRIYISCGEGFIDVLEYRDSNYLRIGHIATAKGARTSLFVPELDRFFLAVRREVGEPAAIWVFQPGR